METFPNTDSWHEALTAFYGCFTVNACIVISLAISGFLFAILTRDPDPTKKDDTGRGAISSDQPNKDKTSQEKITRTCKVSESTTGITTASARADPAKAPITDIREGDVPLTAIGRRTEHPGWPG
jgi:hypothetical protein